MLATLAVEQEIAHVVAEGAADVATAVGQSTRQTATVERPKGVRAMETKKRTFNFLETFFLIQMGKMYACSTSKTTTADIHIIREQPLPVQMSSLWTILGAQEVSTFVEEKNECHGSRFEFSYNIYSNS